MKGRILESYRRLRCILHYVIVTYVTGRIGREKDRETDVGDGESESEGYDIDIS